LKFIFDRLDVSENIFSRLTFQCRVDDAEHRLPKDWTVKFSAAFAESAVNQVVSKRMKTANAMERVRGGAQSTPSADEGAE
jgi:hypothetical protein